MKKSILITSFILSFLFCISYIGLIVYKEYYFGKNCSEWLKLAADANNISIAKQRLDKAINYLEENGITKGYTAIWFQTPETSITEWYGNLKAAQNNLEKMSSDNKLTESDINNTLMKLRETLLDHSKDGDKLTIPEYIVYAPYNLAFFISTFIFTMAFVFIILGCVVIMSEFKAAYPNWQRKLT